MRDRLQARLGELKKEFATGQTHLQELEKQQMYLRETILRSFGPTSSLLWTHSSQEWVKRLYLYSNQHNLPQLRPC